MKKIYKFTICLLAFLSPIFAMSDTFSNLIGLPENFSAIAYRYVDGNKSSVKIGLMYSQPIIRLIFMVQPSFKEIGITIANIPQSIIQIDLRRNAYYNRSDILSDIIKYKLQYFDYILLSGNNITLLNKENINKDTTKYLIKSDFCKNNYIFIYNRLINTISVYNESNEIEGEITGIVRLPKNYDVSNIPHGIYQKDIPLQLNYRKE